MLQFSKRDDNKKYAITYREPILFNYNSDLDNMHKYNVITIEHIWSSKVNIILKINSCEF